MANDRISHVFALSRKRLDEAVAKSPKCSLSFSTTTSPPTRKSCSTGQGRRGLSVVQVDYTITAANAFRETLVPLLPEGSHFRFVFCSGKLAEWDQTKTLHFMADTRHIKGQVEQRLCQVADVDAAERFAVYCTRPSGILPANAGLAARALGKLYGAIDVDQLAKALIRVLLEGYKERIIENGTLLTL
ncbi:hypothetical protein VTI28DRAFT_7056 [Corynascus sepedonium]